MEFKGSKTWQNVEDALNQEALAFIEYTFYGQQAKKDDYVQFQEIFNETASNEMAHAKLLFKQLHGGTVPPTKDCLQLAIASEKEEWDGNYPHYAAVAREEGFDEIAELFDGLAQIEKSHGERFTKLLERVNNGTEFKRAEATVWYCTVCGHIEIGTEPPDICPVCKHDKGHFEERATNY